MWRAWAVYDVGDKRRILYGKRVAVNATYMYFETGIVALFAASNIYPIKYDY
jgi:hypothetical protein